MWTVDLKEAWEEDCVLDLEGAGEGPGSGSAMSGGMERARTWRSPLEAEGGGAGAGARARPPRAGRNNGAKSSMLSKKEST